MKMSVAYCCCLFLLLPTTPTLSLLLVVPPPGLVLRLRQPERTFTSSLQIQDHYNTASLGRRRHTRILRLSSSRMGEDPDDREDDEENDRNPVPHPSHPEYYLLESPTSLFYEERRPMRQPKPPSTTTTTEHSSTSTRIQKKRTQLVVRNDDADAVPDVVRIEQPYPQFPSTVDALSEQAVQAILQACRPEPTARIGLDIQGLHHLDTATSSMRQQRQHRHTSESAALRELALHLAAKLSSSCSLLSRDASRRDTGSQEHGLYRTDSLKSNTPRIPISIYWNTVKQALVASQELLFLKRIEKHHQRHSSAGNNPHDHHSIYDRIQIRCLVGDHPMIPPDMLLPKSNAASATSRRKRQQQPKNNKLPKQGNHALRGLILVVQPTDYNDNNEYEPPGPAVNVWTALQELMASAAVEGLPVVCLSPKSWYPPTPWVLRDFASPVLSWTLHHSSKQQRQQPAVAVWRGTPAQNDDDAAADRCHVFATSPVMADGMTTTNGNSFLYLASCREAPTAQRLRHLWSEYRIS